MSHVMQKVSIYVDVQNIYYTTKQIHNCHFDYNAFWQKVILNRNKIKRRLRSAIQKRLKNNKFIDTNYSYIIFGKSKTFTEKYSIISDELDKTFFKINKINNRNEVH